MSEPVNRTTALAEAVLAYRDRMAEHLETKNADAATKKIRKAAWHRAREAKALMIKLAEEALHQ